MLGIRKIIRRTKLVFVIAVVAIISIPLFPPLLKGDLGGFSGTALAQTMPSGWYWPTGSSDFCGYLGWLGENPGWGYHLAQDMCNSAGSPVYSIGDGEVIQSRKVGGYGCNGSCKGGCVLARYQAADGTWFTAMYGHLDNWVGKGQVTAGQIIGYTRGDWNPPHLHFSTHPGYKPGRKKWRGYTRNMNKTFGFTDPIPFLNEHPAQTPSDGAWEELAGSATGGGVSNNTDDSWVPSLALDTSNNPHIAWDDDTSGGKDDKDEIYYAYWDGLSWTTHGGANTGGGVSNNTGLSWYPSLALDTSNNPHIAWMDNSSGGDGEIYYAYWDGTSWTTHGGANTGGGVSNNTGGSLYPSLALDASGNPHIAWKDSSGGNDEIYYAYWDGSSWTTHGGANAGGGVSNNAGGSYEPSLALDSSGNPHIAWYDWSGGDSEIYYAYWDGANWVTRGGANTGGGVSNNAGGSYEPSLALDSSGYPHIAWSFSSSAPGSNGEIYYAYWNGTSWTTHGGANTGGGVSNNAGESWYPSLSLDASGYPHIAWKDSSGGNDEIYYAYWNGTSWTTLGGANTGGGVSNNTDGSWAPSLALDTSGNPHIAWEDYTSGNWEIYYRYWNPSVTGPVADFSCEPESGPAPLNVHFENLSSGDIDSCEWDFGDGTTIVTGCDDPDDHTYLDEGTYTATLTVTGPGGTDTAECTIEVTPPEEETLLEKYAPILYIHPDEHYHPTDVTNMLKNSKLWEKREWKKDKLVDKTPASQELVNNFNEDKFYLRLKYKEKKLKRMNWKINQTVYGRQFTTYDGGNKRIVLQYWFFYVYNDWDDDHEGDWEMIQIVFGSDNQPLLITYSIHKGGLTLPWDDSKVSKNGEHPKVYVNLGGHGSWNEPGNHTWYQSLTICDQCIDETSEQGDVIAPEGVSISSNYTYELVDLDKEEINWIEWNGFWGKQGYSVGRKRATVYVPGPPSPPYIDYIEDDAFLGRWYNPVTWAGNPNPDGYFICTSANSTIKAYDMVEKGKLIPTKHCDLITGECGYCPTIQALYTGKDVVFDVYSHNKKDVNLKIIRYIEGEMYEVEFKGLKIPKKGKASFTFSPELNPGFEIRIDPGPKGYYESYRLPDYLEVKEVCK